MLEATDSKNNEVRTNRDWEKMKGRAIIEEKSKSVSDNPLDYLPPSDYQLDN